jgi:hypothetical protein
VAYRFKRSAPKLSIDATRMNRTTAPPQATQTDLATVGYADDEGAPLMSPQFIRLEQGEPVVEVTTRDGDRVTARLDCRLGYAALTFGSQVVLAYPDGQPELAVIIAVIADGVRPLPATVAGVTTGAASATDKGTFIAAPLWHFIRPPDGSLLAIEVTTADIIIHTDQTIEMQATTILLDGAVRLGEGSEVGASGASVGPSGGTIPGAPAVPPVPVAYAPPAPAGNTPTPYVGLEDGIVRAKEMFQSTVAVDPTFWAWVLGVDATTRPINPAIPPIPVVMTSAVSGAGGPGSQHTASD